MSETTRQLFVSRKIKTEKRATGGTTSAIHATDTNLQVNPSSGETRLGRRKRARCAS